MAEFPATEWLGYSMNMFSTTPLDTYSATKAVQKLHHIISVDETKERKVEVDGVIYSVPNSFGVLVEPNFTSGFVSYPSGNDAAIAFRTNSSLAVHFMAVTGDASVTLATEKLHRRNVQYCYYCYRHDKYMAFLRDYSSNLNVQSLKPALQDLPTPFNGENEDVLSKYKDFFQRYGTHVVTKVNYGTHLQLHIWALNSDPAVNNAWATDVKADYDGIPSGGEFDSSVMSEPQYLDYLNFKQYLNSVYGGDGSLARSLSTKPTYKVFEEWVKTSNTKPSLLTFVVDELWSLMRGSDDPDIREFAHTIEEAFKWIIDHPKIYKTPITFYIESDWAEIGLLTPSAIILPGAKVPENMQYNEMKLTWGKEHSHQYERKEIQFYIVNDGYPVDFYISHGSSGGSSGKGSARVIMEGKTYVNDKVTDNNYNTEWFYQAPVNATPETFRVQPGISRDDSASVWDHILEQYLHEDRTGA